MCFKSRLILSTALRLLILPCEAGEVPSECEAEGPLRHALRARHLPRFAGEDDASSTVSASVATFEHPVS
jgi:hypothetical protein